MQQNQFYVRQRLAQIYNAISKPKEPELNDEKVVFGVVLCDEIESGYVSEETIREYGPDITCSKTINDDNSEASAIERRAVENGKKMVQETSLSVRGGIRRDESICAFSLSLFDYMKVCLSEFFVSFLVVVTVFNFIRINGVPSLLELELLSNDIEVCNRIDKEVSEARLLNIIGIKVSKQILEKRDIPSERSARLLSRATYCFIDGCEELEEKRFIDVSRRILHNRYLKNMIDLCFKVKLVNKLLPKMIQLPTIRLGENFLYTNLMVSESTKRILDKLPTLAEVGKRGKGNMKIDFLEII